MRVKLSRVGCNDVLDGGASRAASATVPDPRHGTRLTAATVAKLFNPVAHPARAAHRTPRGLAFSLRVEARHLTPGITRAPAQDS
jgi:hypothetical protein